MGDGEDIRRMIADVTKKFTKQKKAEIRNPAARGHRLMRMTREREMKMTEAIRKILPDGRTIVDQAYRKVSSDGRYWANARQIMYAVRPLMIEMLGRDDLGGGFDKYFTQTLLPDYIDEFSKRWKIAYDARGHFAEPHTDERIGVGTIEVEEYLQRIHDRKLEDSKFTYPTVKVCGPHHNFGTLLYIEKEGFDQLLEEAELAKRYDIAIMSTKGMSVTAARTLAERICSDYHIPLAIAHDFDATGMTIKSTIGGRDTRRYKFKSKFEVIDLGLRLKDIEDWDLDSEPAAFSRTSDDKRAEQLRKDGANEDEVEFLLKKRVELNAFTSEDFITFLESKLDEVGISKIIPDDKTLRETWIRFERGTQLHAQFEQLKAEFDKEKPPKPPADLKVQIEAVINDSPELPWYHAIHKILGEDLDEIHSDDKEKDVELDFDDEGDDDQL